VTGVATTCPSCGAEIPEETGQHAVVPIAGVVTCPTCGATVRLDGDGDDEEGTARGDAEDVTGDTAFFSGHETVEGVMDELEEKEGGPER
jgi:predicted RNA-binding Zn-ribbon protein involved in translation (DUF1610 family)